MSNNDPYLDALHRRRARKNSTRAVLIICGAFAGVLIALTVSVYLAAKAIKKGDQRETEASLRDGETDHDGPRSSKKTRLPAFHLEMTACKFPETNGIKTFKYEDFFRQFDENEVKAESIYVNRRFYISGRVSKIYTVGKSSACIELYGFKLNAFCVVEKDDPLIKDIKANPFGISFDGSAILIEGICHQLNQFEDCHIVNYRR